MGWLGHCDCQSIDELSKWLENVAWLTPRHHSTTSTRRISCKTKKNHKEQEPWHGIRITWTTQQPRTRPDCEQRQNEADNALDMMTIRCWSLNPPKAASKAALLLCYSKLASHHAKKENPGLKTVGGFQTLLLILSLMVRQAHSLQGRKSLKDS